MNKPNIATILIVFLVSLTLGVALATELTFSFLFLQYGHHRWSKNIDQGAGLRLNEWRKLPLEEVLR